MSIKKQYKKQEIHWDEDLKKPVRKAIHENWFRTDTVDYWRHERMYEPVRAFEHKKKLNWITIGDGRFGLDSIRIRKLGFPNVLPADIGSGLLKEAVKRGFIEDFAVENAESLSFSDDSFDIAFCKESYHHFPRGPMALYEMLRIVKHAVILIEPRDYVIDRPSNQVIGPRGLLRGFIKWFIMRFSNVRLGFCMKLLKKLAS